MSVLVPGRTVMEASAGTGKTFQMAQTALDLVTREGLPLTRMVIVTFAREARTELRNRIRSRLTEALAGLDAHRDGRPWSATDEVLRAWHADALAGGEQALWTQRLRTALIDFDRALIATIHGFCDRMLTRFAFESGAPFGSTLSGTTGTLARDITLDFWTRELHACDPKLVHSLGLAGLTIKALEDLARKAVEPDLHVIPSPTNAPLPETSAWREAYDALRGAWDFDAIAAVLEPALGDCREQLDEVETFFRRPDLTRPVPFALTSFDPAQLAKDTLDGDVPDHPGFHLIGPYRAEHDALRTRLQEFIIHLKHRFIKEVLRRIPERNRELGQRTYTDLLALLRDALRDPGRQGALVRAMRADFDLALIDEFQDTDPVQWEIFSTVFTEQVVPSEPGEPPLRLVLVGDPKQAIYAFRGADVRTYHRAVVAPDDERPLDTSYRTDGRLVRALNHVYGRVSWPFGADEPQYVDIQPHHPESRLLDDDRPPLHFRFMPRDGARVWQNRITNTFLEERLPELVADDIAAELARGTRLSDGSRVLPGHCAVLTRKNDQAQAVSSALAARGIPSVFRSRTGVTASATALELITVLHAVLAPTELTKLRLALLTPLLGRTLDDLLELEQDDIAWSALALRFRAWNRSWFERGFSAMFQQILDEEDVLGRLLRRGQKRRATDLLHLVEVLHETATSRRLGPSGLLTWLESGGPDADEERVARRLETDANAVQVVTMHSAKGLEYPFLWCPYLYSGGFVSKTDKLHLRFHDRADGHRRTLDIGSPNKKANLALHQQDQIEEDLRLIYVALTRARHRLVVYWGKGAFSPPLAQLLHQRTGIREVRRTTSRFKGLSDTAILGDLKALAQHDGIAVSEVDWRSRRTAPDWAPAEKSAPLTTRTVTRDAPDTWWRRTSYTGLVRSADPYAPAPELDRDEELETDDAPSPAPLSPSTPVPLAEFPGGTTAGDCFHDILEHVDFTDPATIAPVTREHLAKYGFDATFEPMVTDAVQAMLATPLTESGVRLADVPLAKRLNEMTFMLPVHGGFEPTGALTTRSLAEVFTHPDAPPELAHHLQRLRFLPVRGFLNGAIDLIFEHEGLWYVVDYKSNKLGPYIDDYTPARLTDRMLRSNYMLQYHLYTVALHRYLAQRLPDYDYDTHVGGALYLFLRGMDPSTGPERGVYAHRPSRALIERLDTALRGSA